MNNTATNGGALSIQGGGLTLSKSKLASNQATDKGRSIFQEQGELVIEDDDIILNTANQGGAISHLGGELQIMFTDIRNNTTFDIGGGLYDLSKYLRLYLSHFFDNKAKSGDAIYKYGGEIVMQKTDVDYQRGSKNSISLLLFPTSSNASSDSSTMSVIQAKDARLVSYRLECPIGYTSKQATENTSSRGYFAIFKLYCEAYRYRYQYLDTRGIFQENFMETNDTLPILENQCKPCPKGADRSFIKVKPLPGYWGYKLDSQYTFVRCPNK